MLDAQVWHVEGPSLRDVEGGRKRRRLEALDAHLAKAFCLESRGHGGTRSRVILCRRESGDSACSMLGVLGLQGTGQEAGNHHFPIVLLSTIRRMAAACVLLLGICLACSYYVLRVAFLCVGFTHLPAGINLAIIVPWFENRRRKSTCRNVTLYVKQTEEYR